MSHLHWVDAVSTDDLPADDVQGLTLAGRDIALYTVGSEVYATDNLCTHGRARLCDGFLDGHEIECPLHQGKFDVRDGRPTCAPVTLALRSYPVKIEGGRVLVQIDPAA
jgi:naphthalene 1,2-dioxygenase ferredoxin component